MRQKSFASLTAATIPLLALGSLLAGCKHSPQDQPQPHCSVSATVRRLALPDSSKHIFVLDPTDSLRVHLLPTAQDKLWRAYLPYARSGQHVYINYTKADSAAVPKGVKALQPVRLTCFTADTLKTKPK